MLGKKERRRTQSKGAYSELGWLSLPLPGSPRALPRPAARAPPRPRSLFFSAWTLRAMCCSSTVPGCDSAGASIHNKKKDEKE